MEAELPFSEPLKREEMAVYVTLVYLVISDGGLCGILKGSMVAPWSHMLLRTIL